MPEFEQARELTAGDLHLSLSPQKFGFTTTADLAPLDEMIGQPRALRALDLGLRIRHSSYHIYVAGMTGTGRMQMIRRALTERIGDEAVPPDWMYVNNFDQPDRPLSISLPAGQGSRFQEDMEKLVERLVDGLPKAFRQEDFGREKERLRQQYRQRGEEISEKLDKLAQDTGMAVQQLPDGQILFMPLKEGRPMTPEEIQQLTPEQLAELDSRQQKLIEMAAEVLSRQQDIERELTADVREVASTFAKRLIEPMVAEISQRYDSPKLREWLEQLKSHMVEHMERFRERVLPSAVLALGEEHATDHEERFLEYRVNLVVDNSLLHTAPVLLEDAPNYRNLFGTIERVVDRFGRVITNFTRIKSGSLLRANGGYLVLNLMDALTEPYVWKELKRTLKSGTLEIEAYDPFSIFTVSALQPESIPLNVKLVALGDPLVYHLLYLYDEDFREIFRVKADFDTEMTRDEECASLYGRFVRKLSDTEGVLPFDAGAVAELVRAGARLTDNQRKLSSAFSRVADVIRESDYWARQDHAVVVSEQHVRKALNERVYRSDLIAEKIRELIREGTLLIDLQGTAIAQVNGLAVADLGDYAFGRPSRVTASVGVGAAGIINIERESQLSGRTFDKGVLILEGYLRNTYAQEHALALSAGIAMEQSYGGIDGDSASVAELLCLLSALAEVPLRQDVAVTGSINQRGEIQAVGAVNDKVEGFFDVCRERELSGTQGVCIPAANVQNLVLRPDVVEAISNRRFHIWAIQTVDQTMQLLSGISAGSIDQLESFHGRVMQRLNRMALALRQRRGAGTERQLWTPGAPAGPSPDPRPPLPGRQ